MREFSEKRPLRVMCLGDSITDGYWLAGGWRTTLCALLTAHGLAGSVTMTGPNYGGPCYAPCHAGFTGYAIDRIPAKDSVSGERDGLLPLVPVLARFPADVIFLQIGTNDILSRFDLPHFGERLERLVSALLRAMPDCRALYAATLPETDASDRTYIDPYFFPGDTADRAVSACNSQITALVRRLSAEGKPVFPADVNGVLTKGDLLDGVHPNAAGYEKLGRFWFGKLTEFLEEIT